MKSKKFALSMLLCFVMVFSMALPAFAAETQPDVTNNVSLADSSLPDAADDEPVEEPIEVPVEAESAQPTADSEPAPTEPEAEEAEEAPGLPDFAANPVIVDDSGMEPGDGIPRLSGEELDEATPEFQEVKYNVRKRNYYQLETTMAHNGTLNSSNPMDYFFYDPPAAGRFLIFKIVSSNSNVRFGLYTMDWNTGNLTAVGTVTPGNNGYICLTPDIVSAIPSFALVAYTLDGSVATYSAYAHATNPADNGDVVPVYTSNTLADVTVIDYGKSMPYLYSNGYDILNTTIEYKRERTNYFNWGYHSVNASMQVGRGNIGSMYIGSFSNSRGDSIPSGSALYIEAGYRSFWSFYISQYTNIGGEVEREVDWTDITGQLTPRYITGSGGFIVVDMRTNQVVDHVGGGLSYWYRPEVGETCTTNYQTQIW